MFSISKDSIYFAEATIDDLFLYKDFYQKSKTALTKQATEKRITDFAIGRIAAAKAIQQITKQEMVFIQKTIHKLPQWPQGLIGSIAHSNNMAVAIVSNGDYRSLGVDLESLAKKINPLLIERICNKEEALWLEKEKNIEEATIKIFSAKEAVYKAIFSIFQTEMYFKDVTIVKESADTYKVINIRKVYFDKDLYIKQVTEKNFVLSYVLI